MDLIIEQLVKQKSDVKALVQKFFVILGTALAVVVMVKVGLSIPVTSIILFFLSCVVCYSAIVFIVRQQTEFEYSIIENEFTIDKIINKRKRKQVISFDLRSIKRAGPVSDQGDLDVHSKVINACTSKDDSTNWFITLRHSKFGDVTILISPNDKITRAIRTFIRDSR